MASLIVLKGNYLGNRLDLTRYIPMSKYTVNSIKNYDEWTDSNYRRHRQLTDIKVEGDFTLRFPSIAKYQEFVDFIEANSSPTTGAIKCDVWCNNTHETKGIDAFIDFAPQNDLPLLADNKSEGFTVTLSERG